MKIELPNASYNRAVADGTAGSKTAAILDAVLPEAVFFTEFDGRRTVIMIVELAAASQIPRLAEPWFLSFDASVEFHVVMDRHDLESAGFDEIARTWARS